MSEWWTYRLSDLLMFAPETYYRLFELYNRDVWPLQIVMLAAGVAVGALAARGKDRWHGRVIGVVLALIWAWVGWAYLLERYATINWAAKWFAGGFMLEALLIAWKGGFRDRLRGGERHPSQWAGLVLFIFALAIQPLVGLLIGRGVAELELFGLAPDPTAIATLGIVLFLGERLQLSLAWLPLLWCAISGATLWTMRSPEVWGVASMGSTALVLMTWRLFGNRASSA